MQTPRIISEERHVTYSTIPKVACTTHQGYYYNSYCRVTSCLSPLCPQCVRTHRSEHYNSIYPLSDCISEVYQALAKEANRITIKNNSFHEYQQIKNNLYEILESYFNNINGQIQQNLQSPQNLISDWNDVLVKMELLNEPNSFLKVLNETFQQGIRTNHQNEQIELQVDDFTLANIKKQLDNLIKITKVHQPLLQDTIARLSDLTKIPQNYNSDIFQTPPNTDLRQQNHKHPQIFDHETPKPPLKEPNPYLDVYKTPRMGLSRTRVVYNQSSPKGGKEDYNPLPFSYERNENNIQAPQSKIGWSETNRSMILGTNIPQQRFSAPKLNQYSPEIDQLRQRQDLIQRYRSQRGIRQKSPIFK